MMKTLVNLRNLDARRAGAVALSFGLFGLGLDAAIAHFAGREMKSPAQLVPVMVAVVMLAIVPFASKKVSEGTFRTALKAAGVLAAIVGTLGTAFHVAAFMRLLEGQEVTFKAIEFALAVAPPLAAPGAFVAAGGLLMLLASPRLELAIKPRATLAAARVSA
jgi:hypothetical protein